MDRGERSVEQQRGKAKEQQAPCEARKDRSSAHKSQGLGHRAAEPDRSGIIFRGDAELNPHLMAKHRRNRQAEAEMIA